VYSKLSVSENLRLFARLHPRRRSRARGRAMLEQTGLAKRAGERLERLSGGNRQRVNVAIGLIADRRARPRRALGVARPRPARATVGVRRGARQAGRGVIFSTPQRRRGAALCRRVIVLDRGDLRFDGTPDELMREAGGHARGDLERALCLPRER